MPGHGASPIDASGFDALRNAGGAGTVLDPSGKLVYSNANYDLPAGASTTGVTPNTGGEKPGWFDPQGTSGASKAGNVLGGVAAGVGALSGLAGMYYGYEQMKMQKEMNKLQKDAYNRQVKKDEQQEARLKEFAKNVGNGATY